MLRGIRMSAASESPTVPSQWDIADGENVVALVVFLGVAVAVSRFVDIAARRSQEAAAARSQARTLAGLAATISAENPLPLLLDHLRTVLALEGAALFVRDHNGRWIIDASAGTPPDSPDDADLCERLAPDAMLALVGPPMAGEDRVVLNAFSAQLGAVVEQRRLRVEAGRAGALAEANALRSALLQAVSHDFRTPLASIKASATSLDQDDVTWSDEQTSQFVSTIVEETDRLTALVANLLDMSRIQVDELLARLRAALRRPTSAREEPIVVTPDFTIDLARKTVTTPAGEVPLTPTEWRIIEVLVRNTGRLITSRQLLRDVWGPNFESETNYIRVHLAHIRRKLEPDRAHPRYFLTDHGMGYRFEIEPDNRAIQS